jgi:hypothetical protein
MKNHSFKIFPIFFYFPLLRPSQPRLLSIFTEARCPADAYFCFTCAGFPGQCHEQSIESFASQSPKPRKKIRAVIFPLFYSWEPAYKNFFPGKVTCWKLLPQHPRNPPFSAQFEATLNFAGIRPLHRLYMTHQPIPVDQKQRGVLFHSTKIALLMGH